MEGLLTSPGVDLRFEDPESSANKDLAIHRWAKWIAGFSGDFARSVMRQCLTEDTRNALVLDPFSGVGTTLLEASRVGVRSIGFEINPYAHLVCSVKLAAGEISTETLREHIRCYQASATANGHHQDFRQLAPVGFKSRIPFFSEPVETMVLRTLAYVDTLAPRYQNIFRVALGSVMVEFSNYTYEPSLGSRPGAGKQLVPTAPVVEIISKKLLDMAHDIEELQKDTLGKVIAPSEVYCESFFSAGSRIADHSVDLVVTSPPYMNNYHYVRNTRPQLFWTGLVHAPKELKALEENNFGKFWQTVRAKEPVPLTFALPDLEERVIAIRSIKPERGVYGGSGWANYIAGYMNDLNTFCGLLHRFMKPNGVAVIVIGNSVIQGIDLPVHEYVSKIGGLSGLETISIQMLRKRVGSSIVDSGSRLSGATKRTLYDYAVVLTPTH